MTNILVFLAAAASLQSNAGSQEIATPATALYIPAGFTSAENAEVVLGGEFSNTCYRLNSVQTDIDEAQKVIFISSKSMFEEDAICAMKIVPFLQRVELGQLLPGEYKVEVKDNDEIKSNTIVIAPKTATSDARIFAHVTDANVNIDESGLPVLSLWGDYPLTFTGCAELTSAKLTKAEKNFLVVEPLLTLHSSRENCTDWTVNFEKQFDLAKESFELGANVVVYVKTAEGKGLVRQIAIE